MEKESTLGERKDFYEEGSYVQKQQPSSFPSEKNDVFSQDLRNDFSSFLPCWPVYVKS